ncbi:MAG: SDR family NAD(P)-dependent oxidoreductase [Haliea sp.]|nr:SDR family NAD(P)-dependent oxidoreductase [Haliea sp.]
MTQTILITGVTDGIGLETAKVLAGLGNKVLIHGRSDAKLADTQQTLSRVTNAGAIESHRADLSDVAD